MAALAKALQRTRRGGYKLAGLVHHLYRARVAVGLGRWPITESPATG